MGQKELASYNGTEMGNPVLGSLPSVMPTEIGMSPFSECQGYGMCFSMASFDKAESTFNFLKQHIFFKFLNLTTLKIHINMIEFSRVTAGEKKLPLCKICSGSSFRQYFVLQ